MRSEQGKAEVNCRAAVVGCGAIAHEHLTALRSLAGVDVVGVCDSSKAAAEFARDTYDAQQAFVDFEVMLARVDADVLHVLTPPHTHVALATLGLEAGCHVVCEKPLTPDAQHTERLVARASELNRLLIESQNLRYNDVVLQTDDLVASGRLGTVLEVDVSLCLDLSAGTFGDLNLPGPGVHLPGGAVHDFLPHLAYLFLHFAANDVGSLDEVLGVVENRSGNKRVGYDSLDVLVRSGERRGRLHIASDLAPDSFRMKVRGTGGSVEVDLYAPFARIEGGLNVGKRAPIEQVKSGLGLAASGARNLRDKVLQHGTMHGLPRMLADFYGAARTGSPPPVTPEAIIATARAVDRILETRRMNP